MLGRLRRWQDETGDRLADPSTLDRFIAEHEAVANDEPRTDPDFRWAYSDYLDPR